MTSNKTLNGAFRKNSTLFRRYIMGEISRSTEYKKFEDRLDMILLLADRFLIAFETHIAFNQVQKVSENLYRVQASVDNSNGDEPKAVDDLLQSIEQWHKTLLWLVDRPAWDKLNKNKKSFTLFPCMRELGLLTQVELDTQPENISSISDPVRKLLYWVRRDRNTVTHDTYAEPSYDRRRYLHSTLLALIAPICKHQETIHKKLSGLIASSSVNDVEDIQRLIRLVDGERRNHYGRFVARKEWLEKILTELQPNTTESMHYLLLTGHEGLGKSALCAALATELAQKNIVQHNTDYFGAATGDVRKIAPWLPGVLLHFGKQSNHPHEIVQSLVSQANTLLLEPVVLPENRNDMDLMLDEQAFQPHTKPRPPAPPIQKSRANPQGFDFNTDTYMLPDYSVPHTPTLPTQFKPRTAGPDMEQYRRTVYLSLDKVAREYGPVVLIMDALDEISPDGTSLDFLPEHLPHGVSALLTARRNSHAVRWIKQNRHAKEITLKGLDRSEISLLTGIDDDESDEAAAFNQQVWKKSGGLPLFVQDVAQQIPEYRHNLGQMKIQQGSNSVFQRQAEAWNTNTLQQLLHLLTIFEPVSSLDMDTLQSFLEHQDLDLSSAELRHLLEPVHTQLEGLESGQLKLGLKAFAEYVRDRYCSKRDLARALEVVVTWLSTATDDISARTVASFLQFWTESSTVRDDRLRKAAAKLVDNLVEQRDAEFMYNVVRHARKVDVPKNKKSKRTSSKSLLPNFATRLLQSSAELEYVPATRRLGLNLLNGSGVRKDIVKGQEWLKRAILLDDTESKVHLGEFLLDKSQSELCGVEGEQLLQEAVIEGNEMAQFLLANRLLNGKGVTQDVGEGGALLRQSAEEGSIISAVMLAMRLIHGQGIAKNIDEGRTLLNDLWESGENGAGKILADYLTDKHNSDADIEWGRQILRTMVDAGDVEAMISLSNHLLDGTNPSVIQRQEGETLLHKAIEQQNERAVRIYGMRLLNGDGLQQNVEKGQKLLLDAATDGDVHSMIILSNHFFQEEQSKEGEKWLVKAANTGHGLAMRFLSLRLLSGDGLKKNTIKGIQWLRKAAKVGESVSMRILGVKLLNGDGLNQ
ncbi:MAG: tetratricopeptide repeat protein, partial [Chloroflexota bacterium]